MIASLVSIMDESAELNENQTKIKLTTIIEMNAGILS
jgi:hypothetical protein